MKFPHLVIFFVGFLLFSAALPFPFVFDDHIYLVGNPLLRDSRSLYFMGDFQLFANFSKNAGLDPDISTNMILRPVAYLTFHLNYLLGGLNPPGYRAVNIVIHCANGVLLFELVKLLLIRARGGVVLSQESVLFTALSAALLFAVHPLNTESVTYIIQRFTSLGTFFYLLSVLLFTVFRTSENRAVAGRCRWLSVGALGVGMLTKEFLFTAPVMMVLLDWLLLRAPLREACRRIWPWLLCMPIIPVLIVVTSAAQNEGGASFSAAFNITNPNEREHYPFQYAITQPRVIVTYLRLILLPAGLNIDPDYPISTSLLDWRVVGSLGLIVAIVAGTWVWFARGPRDVRRSLAFYGVLWFFVTLSIDSSIIALPDLMSEHRTYLPLPGIMTAFACGADLLRTSLSRRPFLRLAVPACVCAWILVLSVATGLRNWVWRSELAIWTDTVEKSPKKWRPWLNLGDVHFEGGNMTDAISCFRRVLELAPDNYVGYENLALAEYTSGKYQKAIEVLDAGLQIAPKRHKMHYLKGLAYGRLNNGPKSLESFHAAQALHPLNEDQRRLIQKIESIVLGTTAARQTP